MATKVSARIAPAVENGSVMPKRLVEPLPGEAVAAEGEQQGDAAHHRRQHHGQQHEGAHEVAAAEADAREQPGERDAEDEREASAPSGADEREAQRGEHARAP